jgi:hypothetical protein
MSAVSACPLLPLPEAPAPAASWIVGTLRCTSWVIFIDQNFRPRSSSRNAPLLDLFFTEMSVNHEPAGWTTATPAVLHNNVRMIMLVFRSTFFFHLYRHRHQATIATQKSRGHAVRWTGRRKTRLDNGQKGQSLGQRTSFEKNKTNNSQRPWRCATATQS